MSTSFIAPNYNEPIEGDSLTKYVRSAANTLTNAGTKLLNQGDATVNQGKQQYGAGVASAAPALDYLTRLVKGDQADISQAIQPEADRIRDSFAAVRNMISSQPRGGGKAGVMAEAPYKEAEQIGELASNARSGAVQPLSQLAATLAGLGLNQQNVGVYQTQVGEQALGTGYQGQLTRRGQNIEGGTTRNFATFAQGLNALI